QMRAHGYESGEAHFVPRDQAINNHHYAKHKHYPKCARVLGESKYPWEGDHQGSGQVVQYAVYSSRYYRYHTYGDAKTRPALSDFRVNEQGLVFVVIC